MPDEALQKTLAAFLESPAFDGRIKKLTALSRERHAFLLEAADTLGLARHGRLTPVVNGVRAGFVLSAECACRDTALLAAIGKTPVALGALSAFPAGPAPRNGFVINFASGGRDDLRATLERLGAALEELQG